MIRHPDGSVTVTYKLEISRGRKGHKRLAEPAPLPDRPPIDPATVPRMTRMLVLGYHFERLVREGQVKDFAEIARMTGVTRARVTQLVNLTLLAPELQDDILICGFSSSTRLTTESSLRQQGRVVSRTTKVTTPPLSRGGLRGVLREGTPAR